MRADRPSRLVRIFGAAADAKDNDQPHLVRHSVERAKPADTQSPRRRAGALHFEHTVRARVISQVRQGLRDTGGFVLRQPV